MRTTRNPAWAEIIQLVPVIALALPFILEGKVDLSRAGAGFLLGALLWIPITVLVVARRHLLNPILVGTGLWLCLGAIGFQGPVPQVTAWLVETQATGLFLGALAAGLVATVASPHGYIACYSANARWIRRTSLTLLGLTAGVAVWAWVFRQDVRLGGGLPFIVLNVARRVMGRAGAQT